LNTSSSCSTSENKASPPDEKVIKTDDQETSEETKAKMKDKINSRTIEMMKLINTAKAKGHVPKDYIDEEQWIFQRYEDMKKELKFIDFNDMISLTINKLKEHQEENEKYSRR
jgi:superfamily I DNA/RNA helicase